MWRSGKRHECGVTTLIPATFLRCYPMPTALGCHYTSLKMFQLQQQKILFKLTKKRLHLADKTSKLPTHVVIRGAIVEKVNENFVVYHLYFYSKV